MADTPPAPAPAPKPTNDFKVVHLLDDGTVHLELEDGRAFLATVDEKIEGLKKGARVAIRTEGEPKDDVPQNAVVTKVL